MVLLFILQLVILIAMITISESFYHSNKLSFISSISNDNTINTSIDSNIKSDSFVYKINGLKCNKCVESVRNMLLLIDPNVQVTLNPARIKFQSKQNINNILKYINNNKYTIEPINNNILIDKIKDFYNNISIYFPLLFIWLSISLITIYNQRNTLNQFNYHIAMKEFMGLFFIIFSLFKFNNINGFVNAFTSYDIIAKKYNTYAYIYPFIEFLLGIAYLKNYYIKSVNIITFFVMTISSIGVLDALIKKQTLQCACLGTFFNIPMTYLTLFEDVAMVVMAAISLIVK